MYACEFSSPTNRYSFSSSSTSENAVFTSSWHWALMSSDAESSGPRDSFWEYPYFLAYSTFQLPYSPPPGLRGVY